MFRNCKVIYIILLSIKAKESKTVLEIVEGTSQPSPRTFSLDATEFIDFDVKSSSAHRILSNKHVLVAQFCKSHSADGNRRSDPFMTFVPHVSQWIGSYSFSTFEPFSSLDVFDHYVNVVAMTPDADLIKLNGEDIPYSSFAQNWTDFNHIPYSYATIKVSVGRNTLTLDDKNAPLVGYCMD